MNQLISKFFVHLNRSVFQLELHGLMIFQQQQRKDDKLLHSTLNEIYYIRSHNKQINFIYYFVPERKFCYDIIRHRHHHHHHNINTKCVTEILYSKFIAELNTAIRQLKFIKEKKEKKNYANHEPKMGI